MRQSYSSSSKMSLQLESYSDNDSDYYEHEHDPGRDVIEKNIRNRLQRIADYTKDELNKVLKRVDTTLNNYDHSVQASLIQHGMSANDMSNVEHVADIKELENLLNDSIAKQKYKQRLMVFIVGQTEQVGEKAKLLQQIEQFFSEQKQSFSAKEFHTTDESNEMLDETDLALRSFDVKDCYIHVKTLGTRLNELNEEIIQYLIENAGSKQQAKGKKKLAQVAKEAREQLASLQSKLEIANNEMLNRDNQIETLEKEVQGIRQENERQESKLQRYETEIDSYKTTINELEDQIVEYRMQIDDLRKMMQETEVQKTTDVIETKEDEQNTEEITVAEEVRDVTSPDKETQTIASIDENSNNHEDVDVVFNLSDEIDPNNITIEDLQKHATTRITDLLKQLKMKESAYNETLQTLQRQFNEYREACAREQYDLIEKAETAYQLQIKAQRTAEEAISHLRAYMKEQENTQSDLVDKEIQTDEQESSEETPTVSEAEPKLEPEPEQSKPNPVEISFTDRSSAHSKTTTEELESIEHFRRESMKDKYISLIEEKKQELDELKQQAETILSRPGSLVERIHFQSFENSAVLLQQRPSLSSLGSAEVKENQMGLETQPIMKQDQEQQTSRVSSARNEQISETEPYKIPFFNLYEMIHKFRQATMNLLEQNELLSFANCLQMIRQLSSDEDTLSKDILDNAERVLKDISKVLQTCLVTLQSTIQQYQLKEKDMSENSKPVLDTSIDDPQHSFLLEQKETMLKDLTTKYEQLTQILNQTNAKHDAEADQNQRIIHDQQKLIQTIQQEATRLQKRLVKLETEGVVEPSIMFTRLDAERNEQALQQAVDRGKLTEGMYNELNEAMTHYVELPGQQLRNLVKRYVQFRRATEYEHRIQSEAFSSDTKNVLQRMELLHERRSSQISQRITHIRQQRANLARVLTETFDELADESSIFLIRPVYSYQGRAAAQSYMQYEKRRMQEYLKEKAIKRRHYPSRQSGYPRPTEQQQQQQQSLSPLSSLSSSDDDERLFRIERSTPSPNVEQKDPNKPKQLTIQLDGLTRLQELDIQRPLMPMTHASATLLPAFTNNGIDPCVPSLSLRSYVALSRPGIDGMRMGKPNEVMTPVSREGLSVLSAKSQTTNPRTPHNSSAGDLRRVGAPLPPIRRLLTTSGVSAINDRQTSGFASSIDTNEIPLVD